MSAFAPAPAGGFRQGRSLRWQVMAAVIAINLCAALIAAVVIIANARRATEAEIASSLTIAERLVEDRVAQLATAGGGVDPLRELSRQLDSVRHVRLRIEAADGSAVDIAPSQAGAPPTDDDTEVPAWFTALVTVEPAALAIPVVESGRLVGRVELTGDAADEIEEVWEDTAALAVLALAVNIAILVALYLVLGRLLLPLKTLSAGLRELEGGRFEHRLPSPPVRELAAIVDRFNALGGALKLARDDNARLNERLIRLQDDERRDIASELHDELGPCVFGLRANLESLDRAAALAPAEVARRIGDRTTTMAEIIDRIHGLNRRLLRKIRPMALGHVPLVEVIADLIAEFERHAPGVNIRLDAQGGPERYGECIDITLYRCIQEAVTNALRHGKARNIAIVLNGADIGEVRLMISDDGFGMEDAPTPGFGLIGIEERVSALGGVWRIAPRPAGGACVEIGIPLNGGAARTAEQERVSVA